MLLSALRASPTTALAELAISDPETFKAIVEQAKAALPADVNAPKEA